MISDFGRRGLFTSFFAWLFLLIMMPNVHFHFCLRVVFKIFIKITSGLLVSLDRDVQNSSPQRRVFVSQFYQFDLAPKILSSLNSLAPFSEHLVYNFDDKKKSVSKEKMLVTKIRDGSSTVIAVQFVLMRLFCE